VLDLNKEVPGIETIGIVPRLREEMYVVRVAAQKMLKRGSNLKANFYKTKRTFFVPFSETTGRANGQFTTS